LGMSHMHAGTPQTVRDRLGEIRGRPVASITPKNSFGVLTLEWVAILGVEIIRVK
jgi:hypothetical protein